MAKKETMFIKESKTAFLTEDENQKPRFEQTIRTLVIKENKNSFVLVEKFRKKADKRIKSFKKIKGRTKESIIADIRSDKIRLNEIQKDVVKGSNKELQIVQTNYKTRFAPSKVITIQLVALVRVHDKNRMITDYFIGYSKAFGTKNRHTKSFTDVSDRRITTARLQCESMAYAKFTSVYGDPKETDDIITETIDTRFQHYLSKDR